MSAHAKTITELEKKARVNLLKDYYGKSLLWLAQKLVIIGANKLKLTPSSHYYHLAMAAIKYFGTERSQTNNNDEVHWRDLDFTGYEGNNQDSSRQVMKKAFVTELLRDHCGITDYDNGIQLKMSDADKAIAAYAGKILLELMPHITTTYWRRISDKLNDQQVDADLEEVDDITLIEMANLELAEAMDMEDGTTVDSMMQEKADKAVARTTTAKAAKKKKEAQKNLRAATKSRRRSPQKVVQNQKANPKRAKRRRRAT